jgi:hypothetical protein
MAMTKPRSRFNFFLISFSISRHGFLSA